MTVFADQTPNLVFASPDGANGQPSFRALSANDLPAGIISVIPTSILSSNVLCHNSSENYVLSANIPADVANGTTLFAAIGGKEGSFVATNIPVTTWPWVEYNIRFGPNGNTDDQLVFTKFLPCRSPSSGNTEVLFYREWYVTLQANGANSNIVVVGKPDLNGTDVPDVVSITVTQVDLTMNNVLGITFNANNMFHTITGQTITSATDQYSNVQFGIIKQVK